MDNRKAFQTHQEIVNKSFGERQRSTSLTSKLKDLFTKRNWKSNDGSVSVSNRQDPALSSNEEKTNFISTERPSSYAWQFQSSSGGPSQQCFKIPGSFSSNQPLKYPETQQTKSQIAESAQMKEKEKHEKEKEKEKEKEREKEEDDMARNPNEILSNFFKNKGESQLTDIEYEGVMSLMSKSRLGTPYKRTNIELGATEPENGIKRRHLNEDFSLSLLKNDTSVIGSTPYRQQIIRMNGNSTSNTPSYRSTYKTIYDDTFDRSYQHLHNSTISHVPRRVSSRTRRPAPYRSRIRGSLMQKTSNLNDRAADTSSRPPTMTFNESITLPKSSEKREKPLSETARALLTILDGDDASQNLEKKVATEEKEEEEQGENREKKVRNSEKLKLFENPYASKGRKRKEYRDISPVNAKTIERTKAYSKIEKLPVSSRGIFNDGEQAAEVENSGSAVKKFKFASNTSGDDKLASNKKEKEDEPRNGIESKLFTPSSPSSSFFPSTEFNPNKNGGDNFQFGVSFRSNGVANTPKSLFANSEKTVNGGFVHKKEETSVGNKKSFASNSDAQKSATFKFGDNTAGISPSMVFPFGSNANNPLPPPPSTSTSTAFSFGDRSDSSKPPTKGFVFGNNTESKKPSTTFAFGDKTSSKPPSAVFSFGNSTGKPPSTALPIEDSNESKRVSMEKSTGDTASKPPAITFSFGNKSEDKPLTSSFSFGNKAEEKPPTSSFSFGNKSEDKPPTSSFSFGNKAEEKPPTSSFSFGNKSEDKPSTPAFSFGNKSEDKPSTPAFSFGNKSDEKPHTSAISFGNQTENKPSALEFPSGDKDAGTRPATAFAVKDITENKAPSVSFSFGNNNENKTSTTPFSFGKKNESTPPTTAFSFVGSTENKPSTTSFMFDNKTENKPATGAFSFGNSKVAAADPEPKSNSTESSNNVPFSIETKSNADSSKPFSFLGQPSETLPANEKENSTVSKVEPPKSQFPLEDPNCEFVLPQPKAIEAEIDRAEVDKYKPLFPF
ncbi:hypothetical protein KGF56_000534 [Candida oxycetoniae]|uniref:Uncharacterized protein n=1 Tax=Candida oxycetoniae TaxID=497107 RepID=A0AAI9T0N8_9ASCO|nr:uncharacterized protein KGF56_000534 [Candida oxycetoniae]KAI3406688.2 hypothetical protein KGF56_000534 [Candida oxycetoniae]